MDLLKILSELVQRADVRCPALSLSISAAHTAGVRASLPVLNERGGEGSFKSRMPDTPSDGVNDTWRRGDIGEQGGCRRVRMGKKSQKGGGQVLLCFTTGFASALKGSRVVALEWPLSQCCMAGVVPVVQVTK